MRQARGPEHQGDAERDGVDRIRHEAPRREHRRPQAGRRVREQRQRVHRVAGQDEQRQQHRARHEEHGLDDLHPGRREHPAEEHVGQHHAADDDDGQLVRHAEEQADEVAGAHHLRDEVEGDDGQAAEGRRDADGRLAQAEAA
ncbi:MAG: hypothetical protein R2745_16300 [Vicinamibacterales bacterium]